MGKASLRDRYRHQKRHANDRNVPFLLTFEEWCLIWNESGRLSERGNKRGQYCMARNGDVGPYAVGNVRIILVEENHYERKPPWLGKKFSGLHRERIGAATRGEKHPLWGKSPSAKTRRKISETKTGVPLSEETRFKLREAWRRRKQRM